MGTAGAPGTVEAAPRKRRSPVFRILQIGLSVAVVAGIFLFALPRIADYSAVWRTITDLTWLELATLLAVSLLNIVTYWPVMMAAMPGLGFWQAAVNNQTTTSIANTLPGGGAIAVGVGYAMFRSWGFSNASIALITVVTGVWNTFIKLGMPLVALAWLAVTGSAAGALLIAAVIGVLIMAVTVGLFAAVLWSESLARRIGDFTGRLVSRFRGWFHRDPVIGWGEAALRFRSQTIDLLKDRWLPLTAATVFSHVSLFFVLLIALRHVGVSVHEISNAQVFGVFAFARLVSAFPITPGGLGLVELSYIGGLILAGRGNADVSPDLFRAQVAAAVLVFRTLTYAMQIPLGAFAYAVWRWNKSWRKPVPGEPGPGTVDAGTVEPGSA